MFTDPISYPELLTLTSDKLITSTVDTGRPLGFFNKYNHKIILYSQLGDYLFDEKILKISKTNNSIVILLSHRINVNNLDNIKIIFLKSAYAEYATLIPHDGVDFESITLTPKTKHFLSLNNRANWYRHALFYFFENFNLDSKSYFSYLGTFDRSQSQSHIEVEQIFLNAHTWYTQNLDIELSRSKIPKTTSIETPVELDWGIGSIRYYQDCFCSIITETYAAETFPFFTEKTFKPIMFFQPFLLHGNTGSLAELQNIGFKTFSKWWDESYDTLPNGSSRFEALLRIILEISNWSIEKINEVYQEMLPVLQYNHNHLTKTLPTLYNIEMQQVKNQINEIIRTHK